MHDTAGPEALAAACSSRPPIFSPMALVNWAIAARNASESYVFSATATANSLRLSLADGGVGAGEPVGIRADLANGDVDTLVDPPVHVCLGPVLLDQRSVVQPAEFGLEPLLGDRLDGRADIFVIKFAAFGVGWMRLTGFPVRPARKRRGAAQERPRSSARAVVSAVADLRRRRMAGSSGPIRSKAARCARPWQPMSSLWATTLPGRGEVSPSAVTQKIHGQHARIQVLCRKLH